MFLQLFFNSFSPSTCFVLFEVFFFFSKQKMKIKILQKRLKNLNKIITLNKTKHVLVENELKKL